MKGIEVTTDSKPKISVLITFYNQEKYVDRTIESVLKQNRDFDIEILIGNDASTDNTASKLKCWADKYPDLIRIFNTDSSVKTNVSSIDAGKNRLNLLKQVRGEYFAFLDGDDYYCDENKLRIQLDILENPQNKNCVACAHPYLVLLPDGTTVDEYGESIQDGEMTIEYYWNNYYISNECFLTRSSVIQDVLRSNISLEFNDSMITFLILQFGNLFYINRKMIVYNKDGNGIWSANNRVSSVMRVVAACDIYEAIEPRLKHITEKRFEYYWKELISIRKDINAQEMKAYVQVADKEVLKRFCRWTDYNEHNSLVKLILLVDAYRIAWRIILREGIRKIK